MSEEEVERCPVKQAAEEECKPSCKKQWDEYKACSVRISQPGADENASCEGWYWDYQKCLDRCALPKIWAQLK
eukprot:CAMPEP_0201475996 /NCGR_PEP_ID=MMETSP0151_2-20130828/1296_1 /ASSEMBLY_ACC=CAM_ASM_000257 /TAXON_ID=200890 /ORGANISM="Paramoeba atlantica, Strain 621/1 / CCAP 1560/9" /LENGTH=72 /DNA_ID=CAMNT_0047856235 /DNA_START=82 /DNA_END=300 /DNA_ORIENTATION=-